MRMHDGRAPKRLLHTALILCIAMLCLTSVIGITAAKYVSEGSASDSATVAQFSPSLFSDSSIDISGIKKPGDSIYSSFTVRNYSGDGVSCVTVKYKIVLKTTGNLPLRFTVYNSDDDEVFSFYCDGTGGAGEYEYEIPIQFTPGVKQDHGYTLKAEWQSSDNGAQFSGMTDAVSVSVVWEQVD